ncbi:hypothetical protein TNCV_916131 [Trichonephila clavipes]|nr:hypothetical protein TNCV_916131 [Trichonephila clavipes]
MTPELAPFSPNYHTTPTGKKFQLSTDLTCSAALHGGSLVMSPEDDELLSDLKLLSLKWRGRNDYKGHRKWSSGCGINSKQAILSQGRSSKAVTEQ